MNRTGTLIVGVAVAVLWHLACNGGVAQDQSGRDGGSSSSGRSSGSGSSGGSGCSALSTCCDSLMGSPQSLCTAVVGIGNSADCATELGELEAEGNCQTTVTHDGGGGPDAGSSGNDGGEPSGDSHSHRARCEPYRYRRGRQLRLLERPRRVHQEHAQVSAWACCAMMRAIRRPERLTSRKGDTGHEPLWPSGGSNFG
jgi:hypothetical protein